MKYAAQGFTLIEFLLVMGLIALLSTMAITSYSNAQRNARDGRRRADLEQIRIGLEQYRADNSSYPSVTAGNTDTYLKPALTSPVAYFSSSTFPKDPKSGYNYYYQINPGGGGTSTYRICAYIEDKKSSDPSCPNGNVSCGGSNCNYGITQP